MQGAFQKSLKTRRTANMQDRTLLAFFTLTFTRYLVSSATTEKIHSGLLYNLQNGKSYDIIVDTEPEPIHRNTPSELSKSSAKFNPFQDHQFTLIQPVPLIHMPTGHLARIINKLNSLGAVYVVLWSLNKIIIYNAWLKLVLSFVHLPIVVRVMPDALHPISDVGKVVGQNPILSENSPLDFNISRCSNITKLGDNVVVGIVSTGVVWNHPELKDNWKSKTYGWFDGTNVSNSNQPPSDAYGMGTAALSVIVGKTFGMAPKAKWVACKGCFDTGVCARAAILICAEYFICPWDNSKPQPQEKPSNCKFRPNVVLIQNWSYNSGQLLAQPNYWFYDGLQQMHNARIITTTPIGDGGPNCNSGGIPGVYDIAFAVGAVDIEATILDTNSRGPALIDGSRVKKSLSYGYCPKEFSDSSSKCTSTKKNPPCIFTKPDILALGWQVRVASNNVTKHNITLTGTMIAAAQVAGAAALVLSNADQNNVVWTQEKVYKVITGSAHRNATKLVQSDSTTQTFADTSHLFCDVLIGKNCTGYPSNVYGWGVLNVCNAVIAAKKVKSLD